MFYASDNPLWLAILADDGGGSVGPGGGTVSLAVGDVVNNRVQLFTLAGVYLSSITADYDFFATCCCGDASSNLYVSSYGRLTKYNSAGTFQWSIGSPGSGSGEFYAFPASMAVDSSGNVHVPDSGNGRVQVIDPSGAFVRQYGTDELSPVGVTIDDDDNCYVVGGTNGIRVYDSGGTLVTTFGDTPYFGIALSADGKLYATKSDSFSVWLTDGTFVDDYGSSGSGDGEFDSLAGVALDFNGNAYLYDTGNSRVQIWDSSPAFLSAFGSAGPGNGQFGETGGIQGLCLTNGPRGGTLPPPPLVCPTGVSFSPEGGTYDYFPAVTIDVAGAAGAGDGTAVDLTIQQYNAGTLAWDDVAFPSGTMPPVYDTSSTGAGTFRYKVNYSKFGCTPGTGYSDSFIITVGA